MVTRKRKVKNEREVKNGGRERERLLVVVSVVASEIQLSRDSEIQQFSY